MPKALLTSTKLGVKQADARRECARSRICLTDAEAYVVCILDKHPGVSGARTQ